MKRLDKMSAKILDAASSPIRLEILKLLSRKGQLPYTEIMFAVDLDPIKDAGKFVYHLNSLSDTSLININKKNKKYSLTDLGEIVVSFSRDLENYIAVKRGRLYVRTSKLSIEEFDRSNIANSLVKEAGVPLELAQNIAAEAEERLIKLKTQYLTAPLIREFVNSLLLEKGLEEYRHRLTRLGMPVYDVTQVIEDTEKKGLSVSAVEDAASSSVLKEYVLLRGVPREVADAHIAGLIHLDIAENWLLKPDSISHDLGTYLGLPSLFRDITFTLENVLNFVERIYIRSSNDVSNSQVFPFFNIFLAPFILGRDLKHCIKLFDSFFERLNEDAHLNPFMSRLSLGISLGIPRELQQETISPIREGNKVYGDFGDEARTVASLLLKSAYRLARKVPLINPLLVVNLIDQGNKSLEDLYYLAAQGMTSLDFTDNLDAIYFGDGIRLSSNWSGDWRTDVVSTGHAGTVFLNLARVAYESKGNFERLKKLSESTLQLAVSAFQAKRNALNEKLQSGFLPMLKKMNFSLENAQYGIGVLGISEAATIYEGTNIGISEKALDFTLNTLRYLSESASALSKELDMRINLLQKSGEDCSSRLAQLDLKSFGKSNIKFQGLESDPYYTDLPLLPSNLEISLEERALIEGKLQQYLRGGHLCVFRISDAKPTAIKHFTAKLKDRGIQAAKYAREISYCTACMKVIPRLVSICPSCREASIVQYGVASSSLKPLKLWPTSKRKVMKEWVRYNMK